MRDELLGYYERELTFLRQMGAEFAQKYPKVASRLLLEPDKCADPHVERLLEAFAFLAARVHLKLDDEFPEITEALLNVLYPHYLAPVPSLSVVQFALDPNQGKLTTGYEIPRGQPVFARQVQGVSCRFRTSYPVVLWPIEVAEAALETPAPLGARGSYSEATLRLRLRCTNDTKLSELFLEHPGQQPQRIDRLRFYLSGEPQLVYPLYELLFNQSKHLRGVELRPVAARRASAPLSINLPPESLRPVGFAEDEGLLAYPAPSFMGYRLLTEYFAFPEKFLFVDVHGLSRAAEAGFGAEFDLLIHLRDVEPPRAPIDCNTFQLGCAPIVNLFEQTAEPVALNQRQHEYQVLPSVYQQTAMEIYSVAEVSALDPVTKETRHFHPFYSYRHAYEREEKKTFWYAMRRPSERPNDAGTEIYLSLVDLGFNPNVPALETLVVRTLCTNRDLPGRLPMGQRDGDFQVEGPLLPVRCLRKPTETLRPALRKGAQWRLLSHLSLNYLSLAEDARQSPAALREILMLYDFLDSAATRKQIAGLEHIQTRRVVRQAPQLTPRIGAGFARGLETTILLDEEQFVGSGVFLFASVLERFLSLYVSVNSFNQLVVETKQRGFLKRWQPCAGEQRLL